MSSSSPSEEDTSSTEDCEPELSPYGPPPGLFALLETCRVSPAKKGDCAIYDHNKCRGKAMKILSVNWQIVFKPAPIKILREKSCLPKALPISRNATSRSKGQGALGNICDK